VKKKQNN